MAIECLDPAPHRRAVWVLMATDPMGCDQEPRRAAQQQPTRERAGTTWAGSDNCGDRCGNELLQARRGPGSRVNAADQSVAARRRSEFVDGSRRAENHDGCSDQKPGADHREDEMPPAPAELPLDGHCGRGGTALVLRTRGRRRHSGDNGAGEPGDSPEHPHGPEAHDDDNPQRLITNPHGHKSARF
jgi:hypothetical protein